MPNKIRYCTMLMLLLVIPWLLSACTSKSENTEPWPDLPNTIDQQSVQQQDPSTDQQPNSDTEPAKQHEQNQENEDIKENPLQDPQQEPADNEHNPLEVSTADKDNEQGEDQAVGTPERPSSAPFNSANPVVLGITIGESKEFTLNQHGKPLEIFMMDDPYEPITVHRYPHFLIGFNTQEQVEFIDVTSNQVDPGLNGLHLGDSVKDAIRLLGEPDINTDYVVSYRSERAMLKLDIDPNTGMINSIKLFASP